jgi:GNAT superfamily N-acetyltransferase
MVLVQADSHAGALAIEAVRRSGRSVAGLLGDAAQVAIARASLGALGPVTMDSDELLMSLSLDRLLVPPALADGGLTGRRAETRDRDLLIAWRIAYGLEIGQYQGAADAELRATNAIDHMLANSDRRIWVVERAGTPVATCTHNAALPDSVQVGGVFTPPAARGRGHARAVAAASLIDVRAAGVTRAILFTPRADAIAAYRAVGFEPIGRYAIILFGA